jgi:tRNA(fMet)-specific endonuclease VapC
MYLLDTNICIYIIKRQPITVLGMLQRKIGQDLLISAITVAELEYGAAKSHYPERNKIALLEFLAPFSLLAFDDKDAVEFGNIKAQLEKSGQIIGPMDLLLAAQAKSKQLILVTNNVREFQRVDGLKIENWAQ